jgi:hypothetical protein
MRTAPKFPPPAPEASRRRYAVVRTDALGLRRPVLEVRIGGPRLEAPGRLGKRIARGLGGDFLRLLPDPEGPHV